MATLALLVISVVLVLAHGFRSERDLARQLTALRGAELSARSGHWRKALQQWEEAEAAGYSDSIHLGLERALAWTVLSARRQAHSELQWLVRRPDLGNRRGIVLLRLGEYELFDNLTYAQGVQHVREAVAAGLTGADDAFAKGLLADSTPVALEAFRQALRFDPYHHGAHRHSLGLEFTLGRHDELENHIRVFKVLFPDDPTPVYLQAAELAVQGKIADAERWVANLKGVTQLEIQKQFLAGLRILARVAADYDVAVHLGEGKASRSKVEIAATTNPALPLEAVSKPEEAPVNIRIPQLPCMRRYQEGWEAVRSLALPLLIDPEPAIGKIKASWQYHPEALMPLFAGSFLDQHQPPQGPKSLAVLARQAELFQLAANSPSVLPGMVRWARFRAARTQFELAQSGSLSAASARRACLEQVQRAIADSNTSADECRAYFDMAFGLKDYDQARALLSLWARRNPDDERKVRKCIELEMMVGAYGEALTMLDQLLARRPNEPWAMGQREAALGRLKELTSRIK